MLDISREQELIDFLNKILSDIGEIKSFLVGRDLHRWTFRYDEDSWNIKVEINKRENQYTQYEFKKIEGIQVQCQTAQSMVTNKLLALSNRWYGRDLYDTHFFLTQGYVFDEKIIEDRANKSSKELIKHIISEIPKHYTSNNILHQLGAVLTNKQKARAKAHLVDKTIEQLTLYLETH